ncbi:hypothetical protein PILCRDRAFT_744024 [Piloderma croceum F 1598]|uniref:Uncharacterized protein n=1 Tax=Piloderma croceum (strain F 1598) TaxID=765440 RepID=A0A0C3EWV6_PILCF|nr:hypothetical protein PILCRDRAFT_744024 [Piloderma croceum F 1598]
MLHDQISQDVDARLVDDLERFHKDLTFIRDTLEKLADRGTLRDTLTSLDDGEAIAKCKNMIDQCFMRFHVYTAIALRMDIAQLSNKFNRAQRQTNPATTIIATNSTFNNIHGNQYNDNRYNDNRYFTQSDSTGSSHPLSRPAAPDIFFGRDDVVSDISCHLLQDTHSNVAILGGGGMGKTSVGLHVLHHPDLVIHFDSRRYFISCEAITTANALVLSILQHIHIPFASNENLADILAHAVISLPRTLLILDNFETPWDGKLTRPEITDVLTTIAKSNTISMIITMRGMIPPPAIAWTLKVPLSVLDPSAAHHLFLTINPMEDISKSEQEVLDSLLQDLDYVPLAITLLAAVGQGFSLTTLKRMWLEERTKLLETRRSRLESVEISTNLSLTTLDITETPQAVQLLGILSLLPDGLLDWESRLSYIAPSLENVFYLVRLLIRTALVQLDRNRLRVLSPIRHFVLSHHAPCSVHVEKLEEYFWDLIYRYAETPFGLDFQGAKEALTPDIGNITALILHAFGTHPSIRNVDAALSMSTFLYRTIPSTHLLDEAKIVLTQIDSPRQKARCLQSLGDTLRMQLKNEEAWKVLTEGRKEFAEIRDSLGVAQCSKSLGKILCMQLKYKEAWTVLTEARKEFFEAEDRLGAAECSQSLGDILRMQSKYEEGSRVLTEASKEFVEIGDRRGAAKCLQSLGDILRMQSKYEEGSKVLTEARKEFVETGDRRGAAECLQSLGDILRMQSKYEEGSKVITEARKESVEIEDHFGAAQCSKSLGNTLRMQLKYEEGLKVLMKARKECFEIGDRLGATQCSQSLGDILRLQSKHKEGSKVLSEARKEYVEIGDRRGAAQCLQSIGNILRTQSKYEEGSKVLKEARNEFVEIGDRRGAAHACKAWGTSFICSQNTRKGRKS